MRFLYRASRKMLGLIALRMHCLTFAISGARTFPSTAAVERKSVGSATSISEAGCCEEECPLPAPARSSLAAGLLARNCRGVAQIHGMTHKSAVKPTT